MSLLLQAEYKTSVGPARPSWAVDIPRHLCENGKLVEIIALVRTAAPRSVGLPAQLHYTTLTGAKWTANNVSEMAKPNKNYICLSSEGISSHRLYLLSGCFASGTQS